MRWKPSGLAQSLRSGGKKDAAATTPEVAAPVQSQEEENRRWWHGEINGATGILTFLVSGSPSVTSTNIQSLQQSTTFYQSGCHKKPTLRWDEIFNGLIAEHAITNFATLDVAVLACLHAFSPPSATRHILSLVNFEAGRYLRCITLAARIYPAVLSQQELQSVDCLLQLSLGRGRDYEDFQMLLEGPGMAAPATFLRPGVIQGVLASSGFLGRLNSQVESAVNKKQIVAAISMVESFVRTGDASCCKLWLAVLHALDTQSSLSDQMETLMTAVRTLSAPGTTEDAHISTSHIVDRLTEVFPAAQDLFCSQLGSGTGEYMGLMICELGQTVQQSARIQQTLPASLLSEVQKFPSQGALEAIFDQLQDHSSSSDGSNERLKSYLASSLGGKTESSTRTAPVTALREEVEFWKTPPDTVRADFARTLSNFPNLDYSLYTSCLLAMLKEDDEFIAEIKRIVSMDTEDSCLRFSNQLAHRRRLNQLQDNCWLLLLNYMVRKQNHSYLPRMANSMTLDVWLTTIRSLDQLFNAVHENIPQSGNGLTKERFNWWTTLQQNVETIRYIINLPRPRPFTWIFFPESQDRILKFLNLLQEARKPSSPYGRAANYLAVYLEPDGSNIETFVECILALKRTSASGREICERIIFRKEVGNEEVIGAWAKIPVGLLIAIWMERPQLESDDKVTLEAIRKLLRLSPTTRYRSSEYETAHAHFQAEYDALVEHARKLETLRFRMQNQNREQLSKILAQLEIEETTRSQAEDSTIPEDLLDAVEIVGESEYEITFLLSGLSDIQRLARGIPGPARVLLLRVNLNRKNNTHTSFFRRLQKSSDIEIRFLPSVADEACPLTRGLFKYYLAKHLAKIFSSKDASIKTIHSATAKAINDSPSTCVTCCGAMQVKLWKPSTCSMKCTTALRRAPLEVRLHQLLIDPPTIDLLLTSIYHAAIDATGLDLIPGCPIPKASIRTVIDSLPALSTYQRARNLAAAVRGTDALGADRERLLSWLCMKFRGFMLSVPDGYRIPSMPHTTQFLLPNVSHEREALFAAQSRASGPVFHGTQCARLFLILADGLKNMSGTAFQAHGAASGPGVYCADDQHTSLSFAGSTGQSWQNSQMGGMQIMLGCELKGWASSRVHVVADDKRLVVRYVFLLPQGYGAPVRAHVEPAMSVAFAKVRSGVSS